MSQSGATGFLGGADDGRSGFGVLAEFLLIKVGAEVAGRNRRKVVNSRLRRELTYHAPYILHDDE